MALAASNVYHSLIVFCFVNFPAIVLNSLHILHTFSLSKRTKDVIRQLLICQSIIIIVAIVFDVFSSIFHLLEVNTWKNFEESTDLFLMTLYAWSHIVMAITRLRIAKCRGNSSQLVSKSSVIIMSGLLLFVSLTVAVGMFFVTHVFHVNSNTDGESSTSACGDERKNDTVTEVCKNNLVYRASIISELIILKFSTCFCIPILNFAIYRRVTKSKRRRITQGVSSGTGVCLLPCLRRRNRFLSNSRKLLIFVTFVFLSTWLPYICLRFADIYFETTIIPNVILPLAKLLICVAHPLGQGLAFRKKRRELVNFLKRVIHSIEGRDPSTN